MRKVAILFTGAAIYLSTAATAFAVDGVGTLRSIRVGGDKQATLHFVGATAAPEVAVKENTLELSFPGARLAEHLNGKLDVESPHALIRRVSLFETESGAKASVIVNGSPENLKNRINFARVEDGYQATLEYPRVTSAALNLLKEEQAPVAPILAAKKGESKLNMMHWILSAAVILVAGVTVFFFMKFLKSRGSWRGTRKYLIEQLGYCPLGTKSGVSLLKIGKEFVLIGVTPSQITYLSNLPKLGEQYEEEAQFERGVFRDAVTEEFNSMKESANA